MAVEFTAQQRSAIESRGGALIVAAAAGSGKTAVLVERVLRRITQPQDPVDLDSLLIVTFTNAAAGEMRERVAASILQQLSQNPDSRRLRRQLALLGSARIQTVHSFCLDLVRQNFSQCGVSPSFRLLDNAESELLKDQAMEDMLEQQYAGPDPDFQAALDNFAEERGDRKLQAAVRKLYENLRSHADPQGWLDRALETMKLAAGSQPQQLPWSQAMLDFCRETMEYQLQRLRQAYSLLEEQPDVLAKYGPAFDQCLAAAKAILSAAGQGWDPCYQALQQFAKPKLNAVRGADKDFTDRMKQARDEFAASVEFLVQQVVSRPSAQVRREMGLSLPILRGLASLERAFEREYDQLKRQQNALDFSDLEHLALGLLTDRATGQPTQLAQQLAQGIQEILVDEYQDTNEIQDCIFSALRRPGNSLFMVGDVKQSIYRFRLAEPEIFVDKYYQYQDYQADPDAPRKRLMLNKNFRSRREVLELTNFIFSRLMSRDFGGVEYDERERLYLGRPDFAGSCPAEVYLLDMKRDKDKEEEEESVEKAVYEAEFVGSLVARQLRQTQVRDKQTGLPRQARPEDVAVLLSSFTNKAPLYQQALERRGIPSSAGGGDFYGSIETAVMRSMLAVIDNPRQDIPLISVMRSPLYLFTPDELLAIRQLDPKGDFYDALLQSQHPHARSFVEDLHRFRAYRPDISVGRLVALIYARTGALGVFQALDNGVQRRRNLQKFYQLALQYENSGSRGLFGFLRNLEKRAQEKEPPSDPAPGAVKLISVHRSKGLEFPIVVLPDLDKRFNTDDLRRPMVMHKKTGLAFQLRDQKRRVEYKTQLQQAILLRCRQESREEELRKLYVAMTRAQEKLILTMALPKAEDRLRQWERLYDEQGRLPRGAVADQASASMWVGAPLLRHPAGGPLREYAGLPLRAPDQDARAGDLYCAVVPFDAGLQQEEVVFRDPEMPAEQLTLDMPKYRLLQQFTYPHQAAVNLPSKLTPTGLNQLEQDGALLEWEPEEQQDQPKIQLYQTKGRREAVRLGTLFHRCMQLVDWQACRTPAGAAKELDRLRRQGRLPPESTRIPAKPVAEFVNSPLGRLAQQGECLREYQFSALFTPAELGLEGGDQEHILVNGIIDLLIQTPEGLEIVDFKSDRLEPGQQQAQARRYQRQLALYAQAAEKILERPVRRRWVYFLASGQSVEV